MKFFLVFIVSLSAVIIQAQLPAVQGWADSKTLIVTKEGRENGILEYFTLNIQSGIFVPIKQPDIAKFDLRLSKTDGANFVENRGKRFLLNRDTSGSSEPEFSPDSSFIAYASNFNLYVYDVKDNSVNKLTHDGCEGILNGYASWLYMEEIFGRNSYFKAFWWSPDSKKLLFYKFDERKVAIYPLVDLSMDNVVISEQRYPLAGGANPSVIIGIADVQTNKVDYTDACVKQTCYLGTPYWSGISKNVLVPATTRGQDTLVIYALDISSLTTKIVYREFQKTWVDLEAPQRITFFKKTSNFIVRSDKSGRCHLYLFGANGKLKGQITSGDFDVLEILKINEKDNWLYFLGNKENAARKDLYRVNLASREIQRVSSGDFSYTLFGFSPDNKFLICTRSNLGHPRQLVAITCDGKQLNMLATAQNDRVYDKRKKEIVLVQSDDGKFPLPVRIIYPENWLQTKKYPVRIAIYGGPGFQSVYDTYMPSLVTGLPDSVMYISMDHRGSGFFGKRGMNYLHRQLGRWEIEDYTACVKFLIAEKNADTSNIKISGYSYGGYLTCLALTKGFEYFTEGNAGGAVIDWRLYDSFYTEKYMDMPVENPIGYEQSSVLPYIANLRGHLKISHGLLDDNVHFQNTIHFLKEINELGKQEHVILNIYPSSRH